MLPEFVTEDDFDWLIEEIDPDWKDHFLTVDQALEFYKGTVVMDCALAVLKKEK